MAVMKNKHKVMPAAPSAVFDPNAYRMVGEIADTFDIVDPTLAPEGHDPRDAVFVETTSSSHFLAELEPGQTALAWAQEVKDAGGYYDEEYKRFYPWHAITSIVFRAHDHYTRGR